MDNKLAEIFEQDIDNLMNVLKTKFPRSLPVYNWLRVHQSWKNKMSEIKVEVLCPRGDWSLGSVAAICSGLMTNDKVDLVVFADNGHVDEMIIAIKESSRIPWSKIAMVPEVVEPIYTPMKALLFEKINKKCLAFDGFVYQMSKEKAAALELKIPTDPDITIERLQEEHLETIHKLWYYNDDCCKPINRAIVLHNINVGVFMNGKLVSMAVEAERGGLGMVVTDPDFLHRGFAVIAMTHVIRAMGEAGNNVHSVVANVHTASVNLHHKIGLQQTDVAVGYFRFGFSERGVKRE